MKSYRIVRRLEIGDDFEQVKLELIDLARRGHAQVAYLVNESRDLLLKVNMKMSCSSISFPTVVGLIFLTISCMFLIIIIKS